MRNAHFKKEWLMKLLMNIIFLINWIALSFHIKIEDLYFSIQIP